MQPTSTYSETLFSGTPTSAYSLVYVGALESPGVYQQDPQADNSRCELSFKKVRPLVQKAEVKTPDRTISEQEKKVPEPLSTQKREKYLKKIREAVEDSNSDTGVNWNEEFQSILSKPISTSLERLTRATAIRSLSLRFVKLANRIGKVIIDEYSLSDEQKTIKPCTDKLGVAGGSKYVHSNIFFKFPNDTQNLYGGYEFAMKSAGHEARGIKMYLSTEIPGLHVPMMTAIDYRGRRLIAASDLPISGKKTIIYGNGTTFLEMESKCSVQSLSKNRIVLLGSDDAAQTVHTDSAECNELMRKAAEKLNLKGHVVGGKLLYGPGDIEGHRGADGRFYVVDTSRVCPPEALRPHCVAVYIPTDEHSPLTSMELRRTTLNEEISTALRTDGLASTVPLPFEGHLFHNRKTTAKNERASSFAGREVIGDAIYVLSFRGFHLYQMLRPERVRASPRPLSSDAYSMFVTAATQRTLDNSEVNAETENLILKIIPRFALELDTKLVIPVHIFDLTKLMHDRGINNRQLGWLRCNLNNSSLRTLTLLAMTIRVVKSILRAKLRQSRSDDNLSAKNMISEFFNLLLGSSSASNRFWCSDIKIHLIAKFDSYGGALSDDEISPSHNLRNSLSSQNLLQVLQIAVGVRFESEVLQRSQSDRDFFSSPTPFAAKDIKEITSKIRPIHSDAVLIELLRESIPKNETSSLRSFHLGVKSIFGIASLQHAQSWLSLARSSLSVGKMDLALRYCEKTKFLFQHLTAPLELGVMSAYIIANVYFQLKYFAQAKQVLETCAKTLELFGSQSHVYYILSLNLLVECHLAMGDQSGVKEIAEKFYFAWRNQNPFLGNAALRKNLFLREVPVALSVCVQELGRTVDDLLMNETESNPQVAYWLDMARGTVAMELSIVAPGLRIDLTDAFQGRTAAEAAKKRTEELETQRRNKLSNDKTGVFVMGTVCDGSKSTTKHTKPMLSNLFGSKLVVSVKGNSRVMYAILEGGSVYSWGEGIPALAQGDSVSRSEPTHIKSLCSRRIIDIACNSADFCEFALFLTSQGDLYSVGSGAHGRLGHGDRNSRSTPRLIQKLRLCQITQIAVGTHHCAALSSRGELFCWGSNAYGQCASRELAAVLIPEKVVGIPAECGAVRSIASHRCHNVALTESGMVYHWGWNGFPLTLVGGFPKTNPVKPRNFTSVPKALCFPGIDSLPKLLRVTLGNRHLLLLDSNSNVWAAGANDLGQLGCGDQNAHIGIFQIEALCGASVRQICAAENYSIAVTETGEVFQWGATVDGVLRPAPVRLYGLEDRKVSAVFAQRQMISACFESIEAEDFPPKDLLSSMSKFQFPKMVSVLLETANPSKDRLISIRCSLPHFPDGDCLSIRDAKTNSTVYLYHFASANSFDCSVRFYLNAPAGRYAVWYCSQSAIERQQQMFEFELLSGKSLSDEKEEMDLQKISAKFGHCDFFVNEKSSLLSLVAISQSSTGSKVLVGKAFENLPKVFFDDMTMCSLIPLLDLELLMKLIGTKNGNFFDRLCERDSTSVKYFLEIVFDRFAQNFAFWEFLRSLEISSSHPIRLVLNDFALDSRRWLTSLIDKFYFMNNGSFPNAGNAIDTLTRLGWIVNLRTPDEGVGGFSVKAVDVFDTMLKRLLDVSCLTTLPCDEDVFVIGASPTIPTPPPTASTSVLRTPNDASRFINDLFCLKSWETTQRVQLFLSNVSFFEHPRAYAHFLSSLAAHPRISADVVRMCVERVTDLSALTVTTSSSVPSSGIAPFLNTRTPHYSLVLYLLRRGILLHHPEIGVSPLLSVLTCFKAKLSAEERSQLLEITRLVLEAQVDPKKVIGSATKSAWDTLQEMPENNDLKELFRAYSSREPHLH